MQNTPKDARAIQEARTAHEVMLLNYNPVAEESPFTAPGFGEPMGVGFFGDRNVRGN